MALFIVMFNGLLEIFIESRQTYAATDNITRLQENGRTAADILTASLRRAGYMGANTGEFAIEGTTPPVADAATCPINGIVWVTMVNQGLFGINDADTGYACVDDYIRGDIATMRYASPWQVATADMTSGRVYLRTSLFTGRMFLGSAQGNIANVVNDTTVDQHEVLAYTYYIADTGRTCNGAAIPGLFREAAGGDGRPHPEEVVAGIEHIQFQYNLQTGSNYQYVNADDIALDDWSNVRSVKMWILARSECPEGGYTDPRTYILGDAANYTPNDSYRRYLFTTTVAMRNLAID